MLITEKDYELIWKQITRMLTLKVKQKDDVNWEQQFACCWRIIDTLESSLHMFSQIQMDRLRLHAGAGVISNKSDIDWEAFSNIEQNMANVLGKLVGIASFLSTHNSRVVKRGEKDFDMMGLTHVVRQDENTKSFEYEKELVACERFLALTRMAYYKNNESEKQL